MSKFNKKTTVLARPAVTSPVVTSVIADTVTHNGAPAYSRDVKSELYLLGLSNFGGEKTFYESAEHRDDRFHQMVAQVAVEDPAWLAGYLPWLRTVVGMRTAPVTAAVEALQAMVAAKIPGGMGLLDSVLRRPDAPGEALAYYAMRYGRRFPIPLKKACARAATRMYTQKSVVRYDTASHAFRFGDVIELCHPRPVGPEQILLFKACIDRAHKRPNPRYDRLHMLTLDAALRADAEADPSVVADTDRLQSAGWVFQNALPYAGDGSPVSKKDMWEAVIPLMGYEALVKNLAGFDRAGVSDPVAADVCARLAAPEQVRRAKVLPYQMLAAFQQVPSLRWGVALEKALHASLSNIPQLAGRSLVLVDTSQSMHGYTLSGKSKMTVAQAAAVFGVALAGGQLDAELYGFASGTFRHQLPTASAFLTQIQAFLARTGEVGYGTEITGALRSTYKGHDRVFILTDEQTSTAYNPSLVPAHVPIYVFNLSGYRAAYARSGTNVHTFGGLSDATFTMVEVLERGRSAAWPWEEPTQR